MIASHVSAFTTNHHQGFKTLEVKMQRTENIYFFTTLRCQPYNAVHVVGAETSRRTLPVCIKIGNVRTT